MYVIYILLLVTLNVIERFHNFRYNQLLGIRANLFL